jgi:hypothetical protein
MQEQLIILAIQLAIKYGPALAQDFVKLVHQDATTLQDWLSYLDRVKSYEQLLNEAKARAVTMPQVLPPAN